MRFDIWQTWTMLEYFSFSEYLSSIFKLGILSISLCCWESNWAYVCTVIMPGKHTEESLAHGWCTGHVPRSPKYSGHLLCKWVLDLQFRGRFMRVEVILGRVKKERERERGRKSTNTADSGPGIWEEREGGKTVTILWVSWAGRLLGAGRQGREGQNTLLKNVPAGWVQLDGHSVGNV